jgi:hypothetical protein
MSGFDALDDLDEVELGRASIYTMVGEWVAYAPISDRATRIYWLLCAHVNASRTLPNGRPDRRAFPSQKRLAAAIGVKRTETISAAVKELVAIKAVAVRKKRYDNKLRERIIYTVHMNPPDDYTGPRSNQDFELPDDDTNGAEDQDDEQASDQQLDAKPQVSPGPGIQGGRTPLKTGWNKTKNNKTKKDLSPTARPHSAERGRQRSAKPQDQRTTRRADYPTDNAWISDDLDEMVCNIVAHVEALFGETPGLDPLLQSKITPKLDPDTFEELPFTPPDPRHLMNTALKAGRWRTVNFRWIDEQVAAGRQPGDEAAPDPQAA